MSKLFHVTLQKWKAQTGDLLETLKRFLLHFLTTYDESNHQSLIVQIHSTKTYFWSSLSMRACRLCMWRWP